MLRSRSAVLIALLGAVGGLVGCSAGSDDPKPLAVHARFDSGTVPPPATGEAARLMAAVIEYPEVVADASRESETVQQRTTGR